MKEKIIVFVLVLFLFSNVVMAAIDEDYYVRCREDIEVDIDNSTFTINMPGKEVALSCGQQLTKSYDFDFYEEATATCKSDQILGNFSGFFQEFTSDFDSFITSYNKTPPYYDNYLVCSEELANCNAEQKTLQSQANKKDYKDDYDSCTTNLVKAQGERDQCQASLQTNNRDLESCRDERDKFADQKWLFGFAGLILGAVGMHQYKRKDKKIATSPAEKQLPSSR